VHPRAADGRRFLVQTLRYLADQGVHQHVTVGAGEASHRDFQEAARTVDPWARTATVDVGTGQLMLLHTLCHAGNAQDRTPATAADQGRAELLSPAQLWPAAVEAGVDPSHPLSLVIAGVLHHVEDDDLARDSVSRLVRALPEGSFVVATHASSEHPSSGLRAAERAYGLAGMPFRARTRGEVADLLSGLELVQPGVELLSAWYDGVGRTTTASTEPVACWGVVGRVRPRVDVTIDATQAS
jgi:hypothetical protein